MLFKQAKVGSDPFGQAKPFPHILLPGMIKANCRGALYEGLYQWQATSDKAFYPQIKLSSVVNLLLWELSSSTLIRHFATLAGTAPLLPDPFLVGGGSRKWQDEMITQSADQNFFPRHPKTNLQNVIRLEIFLSDDHQATFPLELVCNDQPSTFYLVSNGTALITRSENYQMIVRTSVPKHWCSLVSYYYINDHARENSGQEQNHGY